MIQVGIIGGAGYTAGELIRILLQHPKATINFIYSTSQAGKPVNSIHQDLIGETDLCFTGEINPSVDVVFLCLGHGNSTIFLENHTFSKETKIIDLSSDFRFEATDNPYVYGIPELKKKEIEKASFLANPGCFSTAMNLALMPLAAENLLQGELHINGVTGSTGAGTSPSPTTHFSWRDNNFSTYKAFEHQHLKELKQLIQNLQPSYKFGIHFIPNRGNFSRGIHLTAYTDFKGTQAEAIDIYTNYYASAPFTHLTQQPLHLKQVVNTNKCLLRVQKFGDKLLITSIIDNLLKGASGQAVQNMNLMFGLDQTSGLNFKATYH